MSTLNQDAPPAEAPKSTGGDFVKLPPFPAAGQQILTIVAYNYIKDYVNTKQDGSTETFNAVEFYLGALVDGTVCFIKTWPKRYSINEKAGYTKFYRAALGKDPVAGSSPKDLLGAGLTANIEVKDKVGKKGTPYKSCAGKDFAAVHPKLKSEITPLEKLLPTLQDVLSGQGEE